MSVSELSQAAATIEKRYLDQENPDYLTAHAEFSKLISPGDASESEWGSATSGTKNDASSCWKRVTLSEAQAADEVIARVHKDIESGMEIYDRIINNLMSVSDHLKSVEGGGTDAKAEETEEGAVNNSWFGNVFTSKSAPAEADDAWKCIFETEPGQAEGKAFKKITSKMVEQPDGADPVEELFGHFCVQMVIDTPMENVMLQGYEVDLWNTFWFFVRNGYNHGDGHYRAWNQVGYGVTGVPMHLRLQSRMTRFIDSNRGYIVQFAEPNTEKAEYLDHGDDSNFLDVTSYMAFLPTVTKEGKAATFLCWYSVFPSGSTWPRWVVDLALDLVFPGLVKGIRDGIQAVQDSEVHAERKQEDKIGLYKLCRELQEAGIAYQKETFEKGFRILPCALPREYFIR